MPRIDPQQLLKCLSVLLSPNGGIKSQDEVQRLASLMTKFSKKLVSKCIYVSILKATETDFLVMFMSAGGWDLTFSWLSDGVADKNWPFVTELVDLLLKCPVDIDRLKTNACPKLIKTLSKDPSAAENVRVLACQLVELWLKIVRGDDSAPPKVEVQASTSVTQPSTSSEIGNSDNHKNCSDNETKSDSGEVNSDGHSLPVYKITIRDGKRVLAEVSGSQRLSSDAGDEENSSSTEDLNQDEVEPGDDEVEEDDDDEDYVIKPVKLHKKPPVKSKKQISKKTPKVRGGLKKKQDSIDSSSSNGMSPSQQKDSVKPAAKKIKAVQPKLKGRPTGKNKILPADTKANETVSTKSSAVTKEPEKTVSPKQKDRPSLSLKNKKSVNLSKGKEKTENKLVKLEEKEKKKLEIDSLTDKEKESLSKFITPPISKLGKIPKKSSSNKEEKQSEENNRTLKEEGSDNKSDIKKNSEMKSEVKKNELKKIPEVKRPEKKYSISIEPKRSAPSELKPKTVKTYNSKFRSTGLEEEIKPPPPKIIAPKKPSVPFPPVFSLPDKKSVKRSSPPPPEVNIPEKRSKPDSPIEDKKPFEKSGGIKLIPPKPKPMFLQESDVFMDAMLAANTMKEPRKRKRRGSVSKDGPPDPKRESATGNNSPTSSPNSSPSSAKPTFKFYQDTLDTSTEDEKSESKYEDDNLEFSEPNTDELGDDQKSLSSEEDKPSVKIEVGNSGPLRGVLVHLKTKRQKKSVSWKEVGLECIKYFELDETERVNVTKNFADMKSMEREHERENFQMARKLAVDDIMEEKMRWKALTPVDTVGAAVVAPGKNSQEKEIQYAREKTVPAAIYFNKRTIPDSPSEPDLEIHATTDPAVIPLEDITGSTDSINDFTSTPWPEPRGQPPPPAVPPPPAPGPGPSFPAVPAMVPPQGFPPGPQGPFPPMGPPFMPGPAPGMPMPPADCWRTADGKIVPMSPEMMMGPPQGMMGPGMMAPGPVMLPPGVTPEMAFPMGMPGPGPNPSPEEMAHFAGGFPPPMGPSPPQMFGPPLPPPQGPQGGNGWQNSGGGSWGYENEPPHHSQGYENEPPHHSQGSRGYQGGGGGGGGGGSWRGSRGSGNRNRNPDGRRGENSRTPICNNFLKRGYCLYNNCRFRHPNK